MWEQKRRCQIGKKSSGMSWEDPQERFPLLEKCHPQKTTVGVTLFTWGWPMLSIREKSSVATWQLVSLWKSLPRYFFDVRKMKRTLSGNVWKNGRNMCKPIGLTPTPTCSKFSDNWFKIDVRSSVSDPRENDKSEGPQTPTKTKKMQNFGPNKFKKHCKSR